MHNNNLVLILLVLIFLTIGATVPLRATAQTNLDDKTRANEYSSGAPRDFNLNRRFQQSARQPHLGIADRLALHASVADVGALSAATTKPTNGFFKRFVKAYANDWNRAAAGG